MAIYIDIPQIAYKTWCIEINTGNKIMDLYLERELEQTKEIKQYPYSKDHDHVR